MPTETLQNLQTLLNDREVDGARVLRESGRLLSDIEDLIADIEDRETELAIRSGRLDQREKLLDQSLAELLLISKRLGVAKHEDSELTHGETDSVSQESFVERSSQKSTSGQTSDPTSIRSKEIVTASHEQFRRSRPKS